MKRLLLTACLLSSVVLMMAQQPVTLMSLTQLASKQLTPMQSMSDGIHYTAISNTGKAIEQFEYATGKKVADLMDLEKIKDAPIASIQGYEINATGTRILVYTNSKPLFRHSFVADYWVYDMNRRELKPLSEGGGQRSASFSPDGDMVAFSKNNNLHVAKLRFGTVSAITTDGVVNNIINGTPDWVYEEEFTMTRAYEWSPTSKEIAFIRFDESLVKTINFPLYRGSMPANEEFALYPGTYSYKYPKAGESNSTVSVRVFNLTNRTTKTMDIGANTDIYIPRLQWADAEKVGVVRLNRLQNQLDLFLCNSATTLSTPLLTHRNEQYISDDVLDNLQFLPDGSGFIYVGEMDGYNHIHYFSMVGIELAQLTQGSYDVTALLGYDPLKKVIYYQAAEESPLRREIYMIGTNGKGKKKISSLPGTNQAEMSDGCKYMILSHDNTQTPPTHSVVDGTGKTIRVIDENADLNKKLNDYALPKKEFFTFKQSQGIELNGWMIKPSDFDSSQKYPVLITQYGGPNSQEVTDSWQLGWEQALATEGFIVVAVDPRGTTARGEAFRKSTYLTLGQNESDDLIDAANYLNSLPYVASGRIGIWGWSYGGFNALMCMSKSDAFKVGIAIAPVTDWRFYDTAYSERYMRRPSDNQAGYTNGSPLQMAGKLKGRLLLVHGTADDNVHFQQTMEYADRLIQSGKQFDMMVYPNQNHSIRGGLSRMHLYVKVIDYLKANL